jgi:hypothetical protein
MAEDIAELETRPAEPKRNETQDLAPTRTGDQSQQKIGKSENRRSRKSLRFPRLCRAGPSFWSGSWWQSSLRRSCTSFSGRARTYVPMMLM